MSIFKAEIVIDPDGYEWINYQEALEPGDPEFDLGEYERAIALTGRSWIKMRSMLLEKGEASFPAPPYDPFVTEPALFRIFAALDPNPEAILRFVHEYGDVSTLEQIIHDEETNTLADWREKIEEMRSTVKQADSLIQGASRSGRDSKQVATIINDILAWSELHPAAGLLPNGRVAIQMVAHDLWSAMRLQLAESIINRKQFRECEHCRKPFEVSPQVNRSDRRFCSANCRVKTSQQRRRHAIAMHESGDSMRDIAKVTGSDMKTLRKWLVVRDKDEAKQKTRIKKRKGGS
jgi:uncharacterized protein (UPF0335 family)